MARPTKEGLDYFPQGVNFFSNPIVEMVSGKYEAKGELAVVKLVTEIYKQHGYYLEWNELTAGQLQKRVPGASSGLIEQVVGLLVKWNYFDSKLFDSDKILTSVEIQETYFEATKRRKGPRPTEYLLINVNNNSNSNEVNVNINPQSKVKESKVNKSNKDINLNKSAHANNPIPMVKLTGQDQGKMM
ncbi:DUF4373 domain-containing protein [Pediococcus pentosaceus]|uniref:DUF4373 domain-containing protein n=1 Tax=Pediococcus pentosaceus TaxID=1255 RepID=UPI0031649E17